ncbi:MAG TPA: TIR domain-containing protein [Caulobacteraceae bacterium]|nr:TIR domain-containing protein [Caulobacteraceae bacterium]
MSDVFISYARSTAKQAQAVAEALRGLGYSVWIDDDLPAHRTYSRVIEEQMTAAKAAVVIWSADAAQSEWVLSEANRAREDRKLVQVTTDTARLPMPFDTIQCADLEGWSGDLDAPGWRKVVASIAELLGDAPRPTATAVRSRSICVLPFANMSGDPEQEYFADGVSEDIITDLSKVSALGVTARNTAFTFKGGSVDVRRVAREVGATHVLEGSVRKSGGRVRITAQLIDGATGNHLWAERYDRDLDDIFTLQDEISQAIVQALKLKLLPDEKAAIEDRGTDNVEAYDLYLRGRALYNTMSPPELYRSVDLFRRATALDPSFAAAWATLASALATGFMFFPEIAATARPEMEDAFARATRLAPHLPVVLRSRVVQALRRYDWADAAEALAALGMPRTFPEGNVPGGAMVLCGLGRLQDALTQGFLDRHADPLTLGISFNLQFVLDAAGRFDEAEAEYERSRDLRGERGGIEWRAVARMMALGDHEGLKRRLVAGFEQDDVFNAHMPGLLKVVGDPAKALAVVRTAIDDPANQGLTLSMIASFAAYYGDDALALTALNRAFVERRNLGMVEIWSPVFKRLRQDPRFKDIVRGVGLADHWRRTGNWGDFARPVGEDDFELL